MGFEMISPWVDKMIKVSKNNTFKLIIYLNYLIV